MGAEDEAVGTDDPLEAGRRRLQGPRSLDERVFGNIVDMPGHPPIHPSSGVRSFPMFRLSCTTEPGLFTNERLVHFTDALGERQSALVDRGFVLEEGGTAWLRVRGFAEGSTVVIALPNDGSRVRVPAAEVEELA